MKLELAIVFKRNIEILQVIYIILVRILFATCNFMTPQKIITETYQPYTALLM